MSKFRGKLYATDDVVLDGHHIVGMTFLEDLPQGDATVGQALVWDGDRRWRPVTLVGDGSPVVVAWDEVVGKPAVFPPDTHTHVVGQITDFPSTWAWDDLTGVPSTFPPSVHSHTVADVIDFPTTWAWSNLTDVPDIVNTLDAGTGISLSTSTGAVTVTCVLTWSELANKPTEFTPEAHTHTVADVTNFPATWAWSDLTGVPNLVNSIIAGTGINVSTSTGNVTISVAAVTVAASIEVVMGDGLGPIRDTPDEEDFVDVVVPYAMTVTEWVLVQSVLDDTLDEGLLELDVLVCTVAAYPPTVSITGVATHLPMLDAVAYVESKTGLSWSLSKGDIVRVIVATNSVSDVTQFTLSLLGVRS